ncbi:MAG: pilus assembly protein PilM [Desulfobulbaceae bacterium]|nr:pilus assembly protein PilM [Desulfobulbaceae bacterium]
MGKFKLPSINLPQISLTAARKEKLAVGLDIGSHAVKICQMSRSSDNSYRLMSLGSAQLPEGSVEDGMLQNPEEVARIISALYKDLKIKDKKVAISISGYSVIVKKINLAVMTETELEAHIQSEAEQYIPFDIDDVYLDFQDLKTNTEDEDRTDVMLVAAKKEVVDGYLDMLRTAGLKPVIVDVDAFALENAYEANFSLEDTVALIDIGASKMNINIIAHGTSTIARDVVLGSRQLSEQIQSRFDISFEEAEALKFGREEAGDRQAELENLFTNTCTQWVMEIKRALDFFYSNYPDETIAKIVLSGGGARIQGIDRFFAEECGIPVTIFDPFASVKQDSNKIDPEYVQYMAPEMTLAAGLASRPTPL